MWEGIQRTVCYKFEKTPEELSYNEQYKCFEIDEAKKKEKEQDKRKGTSSSSSKEAKARQSTLPDSYFSTRVYDSKSKKHQAITLRLATFVGATNISLSLIDSAEFRELITELDPRYKIPHSKKLGIEIENLYGNVKRKISSSLQNTRLISVCANIWSKPGMTTSFLGITAHYFSYHDSHRHNVTLAVSRLPSPHTADRILETFDAIIDQWEIPHNKLFRVLTDNGSNMVAAFKDQLTSEVRIESADGDDAEQCYINVDPGNGDESDIMDEPMEYDSEHDSESDAEINGERSASTDISNFEQREIEHALAFNSYKRIGCFIHALQLVVKIFETAPLFKGSLRKAHSIVKKVNKSTKATEKLIEKAKKKLVSNCPTRWDSTYLMISRLLDVKQHLTTVLDELTWDNLTATQWKHLETIRELLKPFAHQTNITSAENSTTIAMVIPVLKELSLHLEEMSKVHGVASISERMLSD